VEFGVLGLLEVTSGGRAVELRAAKLRAVLAMLALHANEVVSTDQLTEALWGEHPPPTARKALQMHVSQLRTLLEPERSAGGSGRVLVTRPPGYELRLVPEQLDLHRFERGLREARALRAAGRVGDAAHRLRASLALWRGPPLADLSLEDALQRDVARLEELRLEATEERIEADLALGRHAEVSGELEDRSSRHPLRERLRTLLMLALYRSGRQAEALAVYRETREMLVEELGLEPSREFRGLEGRILSQDPALDLPAGAWPETGAPQPDADGLVGRDRELADLVSLIEPMASGVGALALVGGEPGIGKSRLSEAVSVRAQQRGARVVVGRCWEAGGAPPYWPWVQALRSVLREADADGLRADLGSGAAELGSMMPEVRELLGDLPAPAPNSAGGRFLLFEAVVALLGHATRRRPLVLLLDDLHAADAPSLLLLRFVAAQLSALPILVVGCYRDTEITPELGEALAELSREPTVRNLLLRGLDDAETSRLLQAALGRPATTELSARIHQRTRGNPLHVSEIGRLLASGDGLMQAEDPQAKLPIPPGISETIGRRLARASKSCTDLLCIASVLGREFGLDTLHSLTGRTEDELYAAFDEAAEARLVEGVPGASGRLRFSHVLTRDVLYENLPVTRRLRLHREIAEALEALYAHNREPHLAELAHHYREAGGGAAAKAIDYAARAGARAAAQLGYEESARYFASALRLLETTDAREPARTYDLLVALGDARSRSGDAVAAKEAFRHAAVLAQAETWPDRLARAALGFGGRFVWERAATEPQLVPLLERALAAVGQADSPERARLLARLAAALRDEPSRARRTALANSAVEMARRLDDPDVLAYAIEGHYPAVEGPEDPELSIAAGDELIALGQQIGDSERIFVGHDFRLKAHWTLGDRAAVDVDVDALAALAAGMRQPSQLWHLGTTRTMLALLEGRFEEAEELLEETVLLGGRTLGWNATVSYRLGMFVLRREQGRLAELEETIARSVHEFPSQWRFRCALVHLYAQLGRQDDARSGLEGLLSGDLGHEHLSAEWLFAASLLPDACVHVGDHDAAAEVYTALAPYAALYAEAPVEASFGSVARGLGVLATALGRFDDAQRHLEEAIGVERRMRARPWLAHAQHDLAAMLLIRQDPGDRERAATLLDEVLATYGELGMGTWRARAAALGTMPTV